MSAQGQNQLTTPEYSSPGIKIDWINIIKQWKSSGLSQMSYCKANNINYNQFVYQNAKLLSRSKSNPKLLPIKISQIDSPLPTQNNFVLIYPNGLKLHIPLSAHPEAIKTLIHCLGETNVNGNG
jgi:hypothetical protein